MKKYILTTIFAATALAVCSHAAAPVVGETAPDFSLTDLQGKEFRLSGLRGQTVVLEWVNPQCPFVKKHYEKSGNIPALQKAATEDGVVWLSINSGGPGKEGDLSPEQVKDWIKKNGAAPTAYFRDSTGTVGRLYDARTTPHMFIINADGVLVYAGAIDSVRSANPSDINGATNYVREALAAIKAGTKVKTSASKPYGCSVKYAD